MKEQSKLDDSYLYVSIDKNLLNIELIVGFLKQTYWARDLQSEQIEKSIKNALCFGLYYHQTQIGFARVITDFITLAWIADVFILPDHQNKGYGQFLMNAILKDPLLKDVRKWRLASSDARDFYGKLGFVAVQHPERLMEIKILGYLGQDIP